jgi:DNA-binding protein H-NS
MSRPFTSLPKLQEKLQKLQTEAARVRKAEVKGVIRRIRKAIDHYEITPQELGFTHSNGTRHATRRAVTSKSDTGRKPRANAGVIRFRDAAGNEWTGHGRRPRWFVEALEAGKSQDDLRVKHH